ncbi:carbohydrate-binding protein, partial [Streptomyces sp. CNQ085]|nr:carbohydrate-binding protein [Streptomyces sp. CNQ085]
MTAGNNGSGTPENDDPFAYLYRSEGGTGGDAGAAAPQPGVPRTSYNHVRAVGERRYGGQQGQQQGPPPHQPQQPPHQPSAHYAAPETVPGGRAA